MVVIPVTECLCVRLVFPTDTPAFALQIKTYLCRKAEQPQSTCQVVKCYFAATLIILLH